MTPRKSFCEPSSLSRLTAGYGGSGVPCRLVILLVLLCSLEGPGALVLEKGGERRRARGGLTSGVARLCGFGEVFFPLLHPARSGKLACCILKS